MEIYNENGQKEPKKLYRSRNAKIGGVWAYLIFWIVAPLEPTK